MSNLNSDIPIVNTPIVDENGMCSQSWFIFFLQLWRRTGGGTGTSNSTTTINNIFNADDVLPFATASDVLLSDIVPASASLGDLAAAILPYIDIYPSAVNDRLTETVFPCAQAFDSLPDMVFPTKMLSAVAPAQAITVTGSPMTLTATQPCAISIVGALTGCTYVRGPWSRTLALGDAMYEMSIGDQLVITYSTTPVIYLLER